MGLPALSRIDPLKESSSKRSRSTNLHRIGVTTAESLPVGAKSRIPWLEIAPVIVSPAGRRTSSPTFTKLSKDAVAIGGGARGDLNDI